MYEVEFSGGEVLEYANIIAENLYPQVDAEGHHQVILDDIVNHKKDDSAVGPDEMGRSVATSPQRVGSYVSSGRMALPVRNLWLT